MSKNIKFLSFYIRRRWKNHCTFNIKKSRRKSRDNSIRIYYSKQENKRKRLWKKIIKEAIEYAKEKLGAKEISLGVFIVNDRAFKCYKSVGFNVVNIEKNSYQFYDEQWDCAEMILK